MTGEQTSVEKTQARVAEVEEDADSPIRSDTMKELLRELPSLPSQNAILLGWASELPLLVKMNDLPTAQQPRSDDPDFWNVWTGKDPQGEDVTRSADWKPVAADWQKSVENPAPQPEAAVEEDDFDF